MELEAKERERPPRRLGAGHDYIKRHLVGLVGMTDGRGRVHLYMHALIPPSLAKGESTRGSSSRWAGSWGKLRGRSWGTVWLCG